MSDGAPAPDEFEAASISLEAVLVDVLGAPIVVGGSARPKALGRGRRSRRAAADKADEKNQVRIVRATLAAAEDWLASHAVTIDRAESRLAELRNGPDAVVNVGGSAYTSAHAAARAIVQDFYTGAWGWLENPGSPLEFPGRKLDLDRIETHLDQLTLFLREIFLHGTQEHAAGSLHAVLRRERITVLTEGKLAPTARTGQGEGISQSRVVSIAACDPTTTRAGILKPHPAFKAIGVALSEVAGRINGRWFRSVSVGSPPKIDRQDLVDDVWALNTAPADYFAGLNKIITVAPALADEWHATVDWIPEPSGEGPPISREWINDMVDHLERCFAQAASSNKPNVKWYLANHVAGIANHVLALAFQRERAKWELLTAAVRPAGRDADLAVAGPGIAPCPHCSGPRNPEDFDRLCEKCRNEGRLPVKGSLLEAKVRLGSGQPLDTTDVTWDEASCREWQSIRHFFRKCVGDFDSDRDLLGTWPTAAGSGQTGRLLDWLAGEHGKRINAALFMQRTEVEGLLKAAVEAKAGAIANPPHAATTAAVTMKRGYSESLVEHSMFADRQVAFPYEYGSDLHWLWGWGHRLTDLLQKEQSVSQHDWMVFRPDRLARDAMMRFSVKYPQVIKQIDDYLDFTDKRFDDFQREVSESTSASFASAMCDLCERIRVGVEVIATQENSFARVATSHGPVLAKVQPAKPLPAATTPDDCKSKGERVGRKLPPSREKAYREFLETVSRHSHLSGATDREVYEQFLSDLDDETPPTFANWSKYVREARRHYGTNKNMSRAGREHGKSVVRLDQI